MPFSRDFPSLSCGNFLADETLRGRETRSSGFSISVTARWRRWGSNPLCDSIRWWTLFCSTLSYAPSSSCSRIQTQPTFYGQKRQISGQTKTRHLPRISWSPPRRSSTGCSTTVTCSNVYSSGNESPTINSFKPLKFSILSDGTRLSYEQGYYQQAGKLVL